MAEIIINGDVFKWQFNTLPEYFIMVSPPSQLLSMNKQTILDKFHCISAALKQSFSNFKKIYWNRSNGTLAALQKEWGTSVHSLKSQQPMGTNILVASKSLQQTLINVISPSMYNLNRIRNGNDNISSEEHFKSLKIKIGSFF